DERRTNGPDAPASVELIDYPTFLLTALWSRARWLTWQQGQIKSPNKSFPGALSAPELRHPTRIIQYKVVYKE
ncbi:MAG: hypothetical protein AAGI44_13495, partial [Pseudomonadota bacterium]